MFLKEYKQFKKSMNEEELLEISSLNDNPLFWLKEFGSLEYYRNPGEVDKEFLISVYKENEKVASKMSFLKGFLEKQLEMNKTVMAKLDDEYYEMNNINHFSGSSFIKMHKSFDGYNYVFEDNIIHTKNVKKLNDIFAKSSGESKELQHYITYNGKNSFTIHVDKRKINDIFLNLYNSTEINLYGISEDGTMKLLYEKTKNKTVFEINSDEYIGFYVTSLMSLKENIKNVKVYIDSSETLVNFKGYITRQFLSEKPIESIIFVSDSESELFLIENKEQYNDFVELLKIDEKTANKKYLNENSKVGKNIEINTNKHIDFVIVEKLTEKIESTLALVAYGKEGGK